MCRDRFCRHGRVEGTGDDYANRRIQMLDLVESIEELRKASQCICCVHVNEEAMSIDNSPMGAKLYAWISDTGVLAFRASGIARALKILWEKKFAFDDAVVPKAYAAWDLWMIRTSTVAFMLLDPSDIATITETFLIWARQAGSSVWDTELTSEGRRSPVPSLPKKVTQRS